MPGETVIPVTEYQDDFGVETFQLDDVGTAADDWTIMVPDRDIVVDAAWVRVGTLGTVATQNIHLKRVADGTDISNAGTLITDNLNIGATGTPVTADTKSDWTMVTTANIVQAGEALVLDSAGGATVSPKNLHVSIRYRSKRK